MYSVDIGIKRNKMVDWDKNQDYSGSLFFYTSHTIYSTLIVTDVSTVVSGYFNI